jgi:aminopeptidase
MDKRWEQLGELLVNYSMAVRPGERVMVACGEPETYPLAHGVYKACIQARALPQVQLLSEEFNRLLLKHGAPEQIGWVPEIEAYGMEWADIYIGLRGAHNLDVFWDVPADRLALLREAMGKISTLRWQKTRWCLTRVPNAALAHQAGLDEATITDMYFDACFLDWPAVSQEWRRWAELLNQGTQLRVLGKETDLRFSIAGRTWDVADGHLNMPDGEIATAPVESTIDGSIYFDLPGVLGGRLMHDIRLRWETGRLVEATASTHQDFLQAVVRTDAGAGLIGEFAIGTNPHVKYFCKDILLDEKIGGTIHIALGRAYPNVGGTNRSAIHWDIIKEMRAEGEIYLDGQLIFKTAGSCSNRRPP